MIDQAKEFVASFENGGPPKCECVITRILKVLQESFQFWKKDEEVSKAKFIVQVFVEVLCIFVSLLCEVL